MLPNPTKAAARTCWRDIIETAAVICAGIFVILAVNHYHNYSTHENLVCEPRPPEYVCTHWEERMKWFVCPRDSEPIELFDGGYKAHDDCFVTLEENARIVGDCVKDVKDGQALCFNPRIEKVLRRDCEEWSSYPHP